MKPLHFLFCGMLIVVAGLWLRAAPPPPQDEIIKTGIFPAGGRSLALGWYATIHVNRESGRITSYTFTRVDGSSVAEKAGLRTGDLLRSINGHTVIGLTMADYMKLLKSNPEPGQTISYVLTVERGPQRQVVDAKLDVTF